MEYNKQKNLSKKPFLATETSCVCVSVCPDGPVGDAGRLGPPAPGGGPLLRGGGDGGGDPELGQVRPQPLCCGKESSNCLALFCQIDAFVLIISWRGETPEGAASSFNPNFDKVQLHRETAFRKAELSEDKVGPDILQL